jgi:Prophage protein (DUF1660)
MKRFLCRVLSHKWERLEPVDEEAYRCKRCGELHLPADV